MSPRLLWFAALVLGYALRSGAVMGQEASPTVPRGTSAVLWSEVRLPPGKPRPDLERKVREMLIQQGRRLDWGRHDHPVEARFDLEELSIVTAKGLVRVTCAGSGRLGTGAAARVVRSRFSMGGRPKDRASLEKQLIGMLTRGIVARLAEISRTSR